MEISFEGVGVPKPEPVGAEGVLEGVGRDGVALSSSRTYSSGEPVNPYSHRAQ